MIGAGADEASGTLRRMSKPASAVAHRARRLFYNLGGPWYRCRLFEALGSQRYSRPALFGMDRRLAELMPWRGGTFVEAGAHDGYTQSNTYYLERHRGWSGVLVEAVPELAARCRRRRRSSTVVGCALVGPDFAGGSVEVQFGDLMSTVGGDGSHAAGGLAVAGRRAYSTEVPGRTLSDVLDDAGTTRIDLLVLDLEGRELDVLAGLDLDRHPPMFVLIETLDRAAQQPAIDRALAPHHDFVEALSEYDLLYRRRD
jgi:FkbM family methyltransferase